MFCLLFIVCCLLLMQVIGKLFLVIFLLKRFDVNGMHPDFHHHNDYHHYYNDNYYDHRYAFRSQAPFLTLFSTKNKQPFEPAKDASLYDKTQIRITILGTKFNTIIILSSLLLLLLIVAMLLQLLLFCSLSHFFHPNTWKRAATKRKSTAKTNDSPGFYIRFFY